MWRAKTDVDELACGQRQRTLKLSYGSTRAERRAVERRVSYILRLAVLAADAEQDASNNQSPDTCPERYVYRFFFFYG